MLLPLSVLLRVPQVRNLLPRAWPGLKESVAGSSDVGVWLNAKTITSTHEGFVSSWATGSRITTSVRNWLLQSQPTLKPFLVNLCPDHDLCHSRSQWEAHPLPYLLDSRCKRSVIARSLVPNVKLTSSHYSLSAANKTELPLLNIRISNSLSMDTGLWLTFWHHQLLTNSF